MEKLLYKDLGWKIPCEPEAIWIALRRLEQLLWRVCENEKGSMCVLK